MLSHTTPSRPPHRQHPNDTPPSYRLLISRASTQRLLSPSLDTSVPDILQQWELNDRKTSRAHVLCHLHDLGVPWERFVHDVHSLEQEIHVLGSERYVPSTSVVVSVSREMGWLNAKSEYKARAEGKERLVREMAILRIFGEARKG